MRCVRRLVHVRAHSRQGWALLFERSFQLEETGCVRACFTRAGRAASGHVSQEQEGTTHQSCTITMSCCFRLDVRSLHRRCPRRPALRSSSLDSCKSLIITSEKKCGRPGSSQAWGSCVYRKSMQCRSWSCRVCVQAPAMCAFGEDPFWMSISSAVVDQGVVQWQVREVSRMREMPSAMLCSEDRLSDRAHHSWACS